MAKSAVLFFVAASSQVRELAASPQQDAMSGAISAALKTRNVVAGDDKLAAIEASLYPTFQALSKNGFGRLESQEVGYSIQRYFNREHGLRLAGLDTSFSGLASESNSSGEDHWLMDSLATAMKSTRASRGLSAGDVALVAAAVEQVITEDQRAAKIMSRAKLQQQTCDARRESLAGLCEPSTGRLSLDALSAGASESFQQDALHDAGAVDGGHVLLANYMSMPMHCTATTELFSVCCVSACESVARSIESKALAPRVSADRLLQIVSKVSEKTLPRELERQLYRIADNGDVRLHGDEFSEWLHYAFPGSCPLKNALALTEDAVAEKTFTAKDMLSAYVGRSQVTAEEPAVAATSEPEPEPAAPADYRSAGRLAVFGLLAFAMLRNVISQWHKAGGAMRGETETAKDTKKAAKVDKINGNQVLC